MVSEEASNGTEHASADDANSKNTLARFILKLFVKAMLFRNYSLTRLMRMAI